MASSSPSSSPPPQIEDLDWEEWDSTGGLSFTHHCLAGSFAGVAEHTLLYPLDTVKTCWQSQVLHRVTGGGSGGGGCDPCSVHQTVNKLSAVENTTAAAAGKAMQQQQQQQQTQQSSSSNVARSAAQQSTQNQQSIWSTMKHLMRHGSHHHHSHHHYQTPSHAHVYTLASKAPNVVDLTNNNFSNSTTTKNTTGATNTNSSAVKKSKNLAATTTTKRPWSKSARVIRGATLQDIAPVLQPSLYGTVSTTSATSSTSSSIGGNITTSSSSTTSTATAYNNTTGFKRLWRGVQTMFVGCIPAHALYFSSYEIIKSVCLDHNNNNIGNSNNSSNNKLGSSNSSSSGSGSGSGSGGSSSNSSASNSSSSSQQHHVGIDTLSPTQAMLAGGVATLLHDFIMTPMDTMKQRMQLGHYYNLRDAFCSIVWGNGKGGGVGGGMKEGMVRTTNGGGGGEGWRGLYRSFPITVMTNVPYGMIMMTTNEWLRGVLEDGMYGFHEHHHGGDENPFHFATILFSGMGAGMVASAVTAPLDRVKTRLQTQRMGMMVPSVVEGGVGGGGVGGGGGAIMEERALAAAMGERKVCPKMAVQDVKSALFPSSSASAGGTTMNPRPPLPPPPSLSSLASHSQSSSPFTTKTYYTTPIEAFQSIIHEEGIRGLFRGTLPRVALHAPSVAISWTAYEMAKGWLIWLQ